METANPYSSVLACTKAVSWEASAELKTDACTITVSASVMLVALFNCNIAALPFAISRDKTEVARSSMEITVVSSFSSAAKSAASVSRIFVAADRSASSV